MNHLDKLILGLVAALLLIACAAQAMGESAGDVFESEDLAPLTLTPAIPGGQPFDTPVELPQTPEPGCLLLASGAVVMLWRRRDRRLD